MYFPLAEFSTPLYILADIFSEVNVIHPDTELRFVGPEVGFGVVATKLIPKGTITWVMDKLDQVLTPQAVARLGPAYSDIIDKYTFRDSRGNFVLCWDHGRFINHSFHPSCVTTAYDFELAVRDIHPGDELTDDYGWLNLSEPFYCQPEKRSARRVVRPDDLLIFHRRWDRKIESAFKRFCSVNQPLARYLDPRILKKSVAIARGKRPMDSILTCYCPEREVVAVLKSR
jgi:SET domain-containing protein